MRERLTRFVFRSGFIMKPLFAQAKADPKRVIYAEGEDERVLRAVQVVVEEGLAQPILIGRPSVIETRASSASACRSRPGATSSWSIPRTIRAIATTSRPTVEAAGRKGITPDAAAHAGAHQHHGDRARSRCGAAMPTP